MIEIEAIFFRYSLGWDVRVSALPITPSAITHSVFIPSAQKGKSKRENHELYFEDNNNSQTRVPTMCHGRILNGRTCGKNITNLFAAEKNRQDCD